MRSLCAFSILILLQGCAALPQSLPPDQFRAKIARGDYAENPQYQISTIRELNWGSPTGRSFEVRTKK